MGGALCDVVTNHCFPQEQRDVSYFHKSAQSEMRLLLVANVFIVTAKPRFFLQ